MQNRIPSLLSLQSKAKFQHTYLYEIEHTLHTWFCKFS
uniref:Uncharacterized protein n=1 Tax=Myoviridae sp. ctgsk7 TaxID=2825151 RepID=A0A8S5PYK1_9CAUD|nr:MAG TPA: hypothetical protein [Myoviridae sp. ctgsk7]